MVNKKLHYVHNLPMPIVNELRHEYWTGHRVCETFGRLNLRLCGNSICFALQLAYFLVRCKNGNMIYEAQQIRYLNGLLQACSNEGITILSTYYLQSTYFQCVPSTIMVWPNITFLSKINIFARKLMVSSNVYFQFLDQELMIAWFGFNSEIFVIKN